MVADYYHYNCLSEKNQKLYKAIYDGVIMHQSEISAPLNQYFHDDLIQVIDALTEDNPLLFYLDTRQMAMAQSEKGLCMIPEYYFDMDTCRVFLDKVKQYVSSILHQAKAEGCSDYQKVKRIYDLLISKTSYDHEALPTLNTDPAVSSYAATILGILFRKKAVCEGISKTFKLLLNTVDVKCICVSGTADIHGSGEMHPHEWNIVKLGDESYHFDLTWAMECSMDGRINYDYFGLNDKQIRRDHFDFKNVPVCKGRKYNYFERNHMVVRNRFEFEHYLKKKAKKLPADIYVRMDFKCDINTIALEAKDLVMNEAANDQYQVSVSTTLRPDQQILRIIAKPVY